MRLPMAVSLLMLICSTLESKPINPDKDVYQFIWGGPPPGSMTFFGRMEKREMPAQTPEERREQVENAQYAADLQRGSNLIYIGIWCAVICIVLHLATSSQHMIAGKLAKVFEWGIVGGVLMVVAGTWYKKAIEMHSGIAIAGVVIAGIVLSRKKVRSWSVSHWFTKKKAELVGSVSQIQDNEQPCSVECSGDTGKDGPVSDTVQTK